MKVNNHCAKESLLLCLCIAVSRRWFIVCWIHDQLDQENSGTQLWKSIINEKTSTHEAYVSGRMSQPTGRDAAREVSQDIVGQTIYQEQNKKLSHGVKTIPGHRWHPDEKRWSVPWSVENAHRILTIFRGTSCNIDPTILTLLNRREGTKKLSELNQSVVDDFSELRRMMRLQNYSHKTIKAYLSYIRIFARFHHPRNPRQIIEKEIREYLMSLSESGKYSASTINQVFNALRFLYVKFYGMSYAIGNIPRPRKERKLLDILNESELNRMFTVIKNPKHHLLIRIIYSGGFRAGEAVKLRIEDIDTERGLIHIRGGKGKKDRTTVLSDVISEELKEFVKVYKPDGYIFEGQKQGRYLSVRSAEKIFERAVKMSGIKKKVSLHSLRHTFATDLVEDNVELRTIQEILGHASSKTTELYTRVSKKRIGQVRSPLDRLSKRKKTIIKTMKQVKPLRNNNELYFVVTVVMPHLHATRIRNL